MIRPATHSDLGKLEAIHKTAFADPWDAVGLGQLLESRQVFALADAQGFVMARVAAGEAEILTIAVVPAARRAGLGRALVVAAAARAVEMDAAVLFLEVAVGNEAARGLYERLGFKEAGRRKAYYAAKAGGMAEDALVLKAGLPLDLGS